MSVFYEDLYNFIIKENLKQYNRLRIVSGYSSSTFLQKVISDFPYVEIELYIGMVTEGLSKEDHLKYQEIMSEFDNVKIYYQIKDVSNHMKLYDFSNQDSESQVFIGSANFSENGFINQQEILGEIDLDASNIISKQKRNSLLCTHEKIEKYITIFEVEKEKNPYDKNKSKYDELVKDYSGSNQSKRRLSKRNILKGFKINSSVYLKQFNFPVVQPEVIDINWKMTGVNSWVLNRKPVLKQTSATIEFQDLFPIKEEFKIYTDDEYIFTAKIGGDFNRKIYFKDINIYAYLRRRLGLKEKNPISYEDLKKGDLSSVFFTKLDKKNYFVEFKNKS